jgi:hypothetical protein
MARTTDYSRPTTPEKGVNGSSNGLISPRTPKQTGLALTEYSANPSPPSDDPKSQAQKAIPDEYILPNGTPDVSIQLGVARESIEADSLSVYTLDGQFQCLRRGTGNTPHTRCQFEQSTGEQRAAQEGGSSARVQL